MRFSWRKEQLIDADCILGSAMDSFAPILALAEEMEAFAHPWFVSGGWAIDLFLNRVMRPHRDREIGIFRAHQLALQSHFRDRALFKSAAVTDGQAWIAWHPGEYLELPIHQLMVRPPGASAPQGDWESLPEEFEFFLNDMDEAGVWRCRRDVRITRAARDIYMMSEIGVPILNPEIQLLFKAKYCRAKDEQDFSNVVPVLSREQRLWLKDGIELLHPGHAWSTKLS